LKDLLKGLLAQDKNQRLGSKGIQDIIDHPWFNGLDWESIKTKEAVTPYIPPLENFGLDNFDEVFISEDIKKDTEEMAVYNANLDYNPYTGKNQIFVTNYRFQL
jgi:hypothetical protein